MSRDRKGYIVISVMILSTLSVSCLAALLIIVIIIPRDEVVNIQGHGNVHLSSSVSNGAGGGDPKIDIEISAGDLKKLDGYSTFIFENNCIDHRNDLQIGMLDVGYGGYDEKKQLIGNGMYKIPFVIESYYSNKFSNVDEINKNVRCIFIRSRKAFISNSIMSNIIRIN